MSARGSLCRALLLALCLAPAPTALATIHHPGKWTNPILWKRGSSPGDVFGETAVNMALLALPDSAGRTAAGTPAAAGVYLCRMSAGAFRQELHLVRIR